MIIRNANCDFDTLPQEYKTSNITIQGDIDFGVDESPAMIKTENKNLKDLCCFVGITLE